MAFIEFNDVCIDFPIYNAHSRSLKKRLISAAKTGGQLRTNEQSVVVVRALESLNLSIRDGDRIGLVGHNGAGKTTFLRLISGIYEPSFGKIRTAGNIGSLIDISLGIDSEATGRENIYLRGALLGMTKTQIKKHIDDIIEFSELSHFIDMPVRTYSTGMHLRLTFAVSTILYPDILIMDEWLSVGDEQFKKKAEERMAEMLKATQILVIATHSPDLITKTCNRVIWLEHGKIRMDAKPLAVVDAYFGALIPR